ncbi:hypothetical protein FOA43_000355 [Brettanomyces nanus]|uniref:NOT2/NOT3/NOT5 C-terminal domain-containing protein n=1 Tax=Eeniella nana TaxID=13502 RepID=A0A875RVN9_EENNA|nr:uncharacterized protein FOA43_000355 [Brettanomyces nanus]QPG73051.1 hypothetical protein FOA43_000355 [Brettanomyces nanus]
MSAWGNVTDDLDKRPGISYKAAAGASGGIRRNLDSTSFNEQFPALDSHVIGNANNLDNNAKIPLLSQQLQTSSSSQTLPSQTKANAQAILNAVKQASSLANRNNSGENINSNTTGLTSSQSATNILNSLTNAAAAAAGVATGISATESGITNTPLNGSHSDTPTPQLPPGLIQGKLEPKQAAATTTTATTAAVEEVILTEDIDKFGLKGLLPLLRMEPSDQATIATGVDLNMLGLDLSNNDPNYKISKTFASPWLETSRSEVEPLFSCPNSFLIPDKELTNIESRINTFNDETLFFIFYSKPRDTLQELAARELNNRNWRYHKDLQVWLTKDSSVEPVPNGPGSERGTYVFFDPTSWEYVTKEFVLSYQSII